MPGSHSETVQRANSRASTPDSSAPSPASTTNSTPSRRSVVSWDELDDSVEIGFDENGKLTLVDEDGEIEFELVRPQPRRTVPERDRPFSPTEDVPVFKNDEWEPGTLPPMPQEWREFMGTRLEAVSEEDEEEEEAEALHVMTSQEVTSPVTDWDGDHVDDAEDEDEDELDLNTPIPVLKTTEFTPSAACAQPEPVLSEPVSQALVLWKPVHAEPMQSPATAEEDATEELLPEEETPEPDYAYLEELGNSARRRRSPFAQDEVPSAYTPPARPPRSSRRPAPEPLVFVPIARVQAGSPARSAFITELSSSESGSASSSTRSSSSLSSYSSFSAGAYSCVWPSSLPSPTLSDCSSNDNARGCPTPNGSYDSDAFFDPTAGYETSTSAQTATPSMLDQRPWWHKDRPTAAPTPPRSPTHRVSIPLEENPSFPEVTIKITPPTPAKPVSAEQAQLAAWVADVVAETADMPPAEQAAVMRLKAAELRQGILARVQPAISRDGERSGSDETESLEAEPIAQLPTLVPSPLDLKESKPKGFVGLCRKIFKGAMFWKKKETKTKPTPAESIVSSAASSEIEAPVSPETSPTTSPSKTSKAARFAAKFAVKTTPTKAAPSKATPTKATATRTAKALAQPDTPSKPPKTSPINPAMLAPPRHWRRGKSTSPAAMAQVGMEPSLSVVTAPAPIPYERPMRIPVPPLPRYPPVEERTLEGEPVHIPGVGYGWPRRRAMRTALEVQLSTAHLQHRLEREGRRQEAVVWGREPVRRLSQACT